MTGPDQLAHVAQLFAHAAIDPDGWLPALGALGAATRSAHGEILFLDRRSDTPFGWWFTGEALVDQAEFLARGGYSPAANVRIAATARALEVRHEHHYDLLQPQLAHGEGVHELFVDIGIEAGCQTVLLEDAALMVGLAVLRGGRDGRTDAADRATFAALAPHVRDAATISIGLERQGAALMAGAWEAMDAAAFVLDTSGRIVGQTRTAERLLAQGRLRVVDRRLEAPRRAGPGLACAIAGRLRPAADSPPLLATIALPGEGEHPPLAADVSALPRRDWGFGATPAVLVVVRGGTLRREGAAALLAAAWDLSAAEATVAAGLAAGSSRAEIAAVRGVSVETVRAQLRAIFAKAGVCREAELVAQAAALIGAGV